MTTSTTEPVPTCSLVFTSPDARSWYRHRLSPRSAICFGRTGGARIEAAFLRSIVEGIISIVDLTGADYERMADLVETYGDFPLGTTDSAVIAVTERLHITEVATLDHRHFRAVRPRHVEALTLLP
ncbi:MAG: PIN domain-containing protein [Dermatophilaceae bacterium]